jgi:hypothetical protein
MPSKLNSEMITAAIAGYEAQKTRIEDRIAEIQALLTGRSARKASAPDTPGRKRRKMSAAGRKAIAEAQRKRWAAKKAAPAAAPKKKRRLSAAGRKAIIDATKKRWALKRAEAEQVK